MTDLNVAIANLPEREQILILRSTCHVADEARLPEALHFCNHVTDLDVARLIHAIERGAVVVEHGKAWVDLGGALRARMPHLTRIVRECLRLGLVTRTSRELAPDIWQTWLIAAPVHCDCGHPCLTRPGRRVRLADDLALVDCEACLKDHK